MALQGNFSKHIKKKKKKQQKTNTYTSQIIPKIEEEKIFYEVTIILIPKPDGHYEQKKRKKIKAQYLW